MIQPSLPELKAAGSSDSDAEATTMVVDHPSPAGETAPVSCGDLGALQLPVIHLMVNPSSIPEWHSDRLFFFPSQNGCTGARVTNSDPRKGRGAGW